jgi:hypothetical protein
MLKNAESLCKPALWVPLSGGTRNPVGNGLKPFPARYAATTKEEAPLEDPAILCGETGVFQHPARAARIVPLRPSVYFFEITGDERNQEQASGGKSPLCVQNYPFRNVWIDTP